MEDEQCLSHVWGSYDVSFPVNAEKGDGNHDGKVRGSISVLPKARDTQEDYQIPERGTEVMDRTVILLESIAKSLHEIARNGIKVEIKQPVIRKETIEGSKDDGNASH